MTKKHGANPVAAGVPPAVEGGILPPGKSVQRSKRFALTNVFAPATTFRRAGRAGSTSAKMPDATLFRPALKRACFAVLLLLAVGLAGCVSRDESKVALYVSPGGNDQADGSAQHPLATLGAAAHRAHDLAQTATGPVVVQVQGGIYHLTQPLVISADLSGTPQVPIIFKAAPGETPILDGAEAMTNLNWEEAGNGRWKTAVPAGTKADMLLMNGERQTLARYPNAKPNAYLGGVVKRTELAAEAFKWPDGGIGAYIHGRHGANWGSSHSVVTGMDDAKKTLITEGDWQVNQQPGHDAYGFIENALGALDAPGEWFLDTKANELWLMPPTGVSLATAKIGLVSTFSLVRVVGAPEQPVHDVVFNGLHFNHTARTFMETKEPLLRSDWRIARQGALFIENAERVTVEACAFEGLGGNALFISKHARKVAVRDSLFRKLDASCVCVVGDASSVREPQYWGGAWIDAAKMQDLTPGPKGEAYPADCDIADNLMYDFGDLEKQTAGVVLSMSESITVEHNTICLAPRAGICIADGTFGGHQIVGNDVFDTVRETGDHGPINSWGRDRHWVGSGADGPYVKERAKLDNHLPTVIGHNRFAHWGSHSWGIDLDDGSSNYVLTNNLCLGCAIKLREGYFRTVENNICLSPEAPGKHCCLTSNEDVISHNIFVNVKTVQAQRMILARPAQAREIDYNLYFNTVGQPPVIQQDSPQQNNLKPTMTLAEWQAVGEDVHSVFADPLFLDPANDDYRVRAESPALKLGFKNFPMDDYGTRAPALKGQAAALRQTLDKAHVEVVKALKNIGHSGANAATEVVAEKTVQWRGAMLKPLVGMPLLSAVGLSEEVGAFVGAVAAGSPADQAGLRMGDVILQADGKKVLTVDDVKALDGSPTKLDLWRGQKAASVTVGK